MDASIEPTPLAKTAVWTAVRQEINLSLQNRSKVQISLDFHFADRSFQPADEGTWANRMILHLIDVINFCFGTELGTKVRFHDLVWYSAEWAKQKPCTFEPLYEIESDQVTAEFPKVWYASDAAGKYPISYL